MIRPVTWSGLSMIAIDSRAANRVRLGDPAAAILLREQAVRDREGQDRAIGDKVSMEERVANSCLSILYQKL